MTPLSFCSDSQGLYRNNSRFDPWELTWRPTEAAPTADTPIEPLAAVKWLFREAGARRVPVAVIGPKVASSEQLHVAEALGAIMGEHGLPLITGGRGGVMEAASKGCAGAGGQTIGLLPGEDWREANPYVAVPLAMGIGPARNALIARAAIALVAVGGEYGTLSEIAFGLHFGKPVFTIAQAPVVPGATVCTSIDDIMTRLARVILGLAEFDARPV